jgi:hypothetical protein
MRRRPADHHPAPDGALDAELLQSNWDFFREQRAFDSALEVEDYVMPELWPAEQ